MEKYKKLFYLALTLLVAALILFVVAEIFFRFLEWLIRLAGFVMLICIPFVVYLHVKYNRK